MHYEHVRPDHGVPCPPQEMSLNNPGTGGICGGVYAGDSRFSAGGLFATNQIVKTYTAGATIPIQIQIWTKCAGRRMAPLLT